jgi:hypothetical protein
MLARNARFALIAAAALAGCGPSTARDPNVSGIQTSYDDGCDLQAYFDGRAGTNLPAPAPVTESVREDERGRVVGEGDYELRDPVARDRLARMLREEFRGIPSRLIEAVEHARGSVSVKLAWWDTGGMRRVRPQRAMELRTPAGAMELPPNVCVSDLLFGAKLYAMRARYVRNEIALATERPMIDPSAPATSATAATPASAPTP